MVIGPPIETRGKSASEINREAESWIEGTVEKLLAAKKDAFSSTAKPSRSATDQVGKAS